MIPSVFQVEIQTFLTLLYKKINNFSDIFFFSLYNLLLIYFNILKGSILCIKFTNFSYKRCLLYNKASLLQQNLSTFM